MKNFKFPIYITLIIIISFMVYRTFIKNNDVTINGWIKYADSVGRQPIDLINMLSDEGISINFFGPVLSKQNIGPKVKAVLRNYNFKVGKVFINENLLGYFSREPYIFDSPLYKMLSKINGIDRSKQIWLSYSMYESDKISPFWVEELNERYDAVILPDKNLVPVYQNSGVKIPMFVVPLSIDYQDALQKPLKNKANPVFTFASFSTIEDRKNIIKLLQAFKQAFGNNKNVRLLINARRSENLYRKKIIDYIVENDLTNVDYHVIEKNAEEYNKNFDQVDCYVSFSKGEGFSVQPREAMARGIPVIVSNSLAQKTIADSGLVGVVHAKIAKIATYWDDTVIMGRNFDVETSEAAAAMLDVYNNYQKYLSLAPKARAWASRYTYENTRSLYVNLVKPKKIFLGDKNEVTDEYLMTNSKILYKKYKDLYK